MGSAKTTTKTKSSSNQTTNPWEWTIDPLKDIIGETGELATADRFMPQYSASTRAGVQGLEDAAGNPSAGAAARKYGLGLLTGEWGDAGAPGGIDTLLAASRGDNLMGNPFRNAALAYQMDDTRDRVQGQFAGAGRLGSGANTEVLSRELGRLGVESAERNYDQERGYQMNAANTLADLGQSFAGMSPMLDEASLFGSEQLLRAGQIRDQMGDAERLAPLNALDYRRNSIMPIAGLGGTTNANSNSTQTSKTSQPLASQIGGGLMTGLGLLSGVPGLGMGSGMLGCLGGMSSLFTGGRKA